MEQTRSLPKTSEECLAASQDADLRLADLIRLHAASGSGRNGMPWTAQDLVAVGKVGVRSARQIENWFNGRNEPALKPRLADGRLPSCSFVLLMQAFGLVRPYRGAFREADGAQAQVRLLLDKHAVAVAKRRSAAVSESRPALAASPADNLAAPRTASVERKPMPLPSSRTVRPQVAMPRRQPTAKLDARLGLRVCVAFTAGGVATESVMTALASTGAIVLHVETSHSEWTVNANEQLSELADRLCDGLRKVGARTSEFDAMREAVASDLIVIGSMHASLFVAGSRFGLLERLNQAEQARAAPAAERKGRSASQTARKADRLFWRLESGGFDLNRALRFGEAKMHALMRDITTHFTNNAAQLVVVLEGNDLFPETLLGQLSVHLHEAGMADRSTLYVLGAPSATSRTSWPSDAQLWPDGEPAERTDVAAHGPGWSEFCERWACPGYPSANVPWQAHAELDAQLHAALMVVAVGGYFDARYLQTVLDVPVDQAQWLEAALGGYLRNTGVAPADWRRHALNRLRREDFDRLKAAVAAEQADEPLVVSAKIGRAILDTVASGSLNALDLLIAHSLRTDVAELDFLESQLRLVATALSFWPLRISEGMLQRAEVARDIASGNIESASTSKYLDDRCVALEGQIPDVALAAFYYQASYLRYIQYELNKADDLATKALVLDAGSYRAHNLLGLIAMTRGDAAAASRDFELSIGLNNGYAYSHYNAGVAAEGLDQLSAAANHYIACLIIQPDFYEAMFNLLNVLIELSCFSEAATVAELAAGLGPVCEGEVISNLAIGLLRAGYSQVGLDLLKQADVVSPNNFVRYNIAVTYYARGQAGECRTWLNRIDSTHMPVDLACSVNTLTRKCKQGEFTSFDVDLSITPRSAAGLKIGFAAFKNYLDENGLRREAKVRRRVDEGLKGPQKHPFKHAPKSIREALQSRDSQSGSRRIFTATTASAGSPQSLLRGPREGQTRGAQIESRRAIDEAIARSIAPGGSHKAAAPRRKKAAAGSGSGQDAVIGYYKVPSYSGG